MLRVVAVYLVTRDLQCQKIQSSAERMMQLPFLHAEVELTCRVAFTTGL